jgi:site-specific recombinase XerD
MEQGRTTPQDDVFTGLAGAWLYAHRSWNTRVAYEADLAWFAAWCRAQGTAPLAATQGDVERVRDDCASAGASPATVRRRLAALTSFFDYAHDAGAAGANPAESVERPERPPAGAPATALDDVGAGGLLAAAAALGPKHEALVCLLMLDGLKLGEALAADAGDLSAPPPTLTLRRLGRSQTVALHATTAAALDAYLNGRDTGPLLLGGRAKEPSRLTRFGADHLLKRASARAGLVEPVSANTLRRRFVSSAHRAGATLEEIRACLGHDDPRTTRRLLPEPTAQAATTSTVQTTTRRRH